MRVPVTTMLLMLLHPCSTRASLHLLQDARPQLSSGNAAVPIEWWAGGPASVLASAGAVRINFRGAHIYPRTARLRELDRVSGWTGVTCNVSAWALCSADTGGFMPSSPPRMPERKDKVEGGWGGMACTDSQGKTLVSLGVYDISACDIMDEGLDAVYSQNKLYHARTALPLWRYWVCVGLAIVLVRALSYNVQGLWTASAPPNREPPSKVKQWPALCGSLLLLALVLVDLDRVYITKADLLYFWCSVAYIGFYLVLHAGLPTLGGFASHDPVAGRDPATPAKHRPDDRVTPARHRPEDRVTPARHAANETPVFNVIAGTLQLLATRLYTGAETPYSPLLTGMIACRVWTKVLTAMITQKKTAHAATSLSLMIDAMYLSLSFELAFNGTRELLVGVTAVALAFAQLLITQSAT